MLVKKGIYTVIEGDEADDPVHSGPPAKIDPQTRVYFRTETIRKGRQ